MTTQSLRERRAERERKNRELRARILASRERQIASSVINQPQQVIQPSATPFIPQTKQAEVQAALNAQRTAFTPLGDIGVGTEAAAPDTRGRPEFGSWWGSGVAEGAVGMALPALENLQKGLEAFGGLATSTVGAFTPGDLMGIESKLAEEREERGVKSRLPDILQATPLKALDVLFSGNPAGEFQAQAEAFRETDMPSMVVTLPGGGIPLPGGRKIEDIDVGVKGAIELLPEIALGIATAGGSTYGSLSRRVAKSTLDALGLDIAKGTIKVGTKATRQAIKVARKSPEVLGKASRVDYTGALKSIGNVNQPGVAAAIKDWTIAGKKVPSSFKGPITAILNVASPARFADTSRGAIRHMLAYARVLDGIDALTDIDISVLVKARLASGLRPVTATMRRTGGIGPLRDVGKVDSVPFTFGEGASIQNTGIPEIDAGHDVKITSGDREGEVVRMPYTIIEIQENFFDYKGKIPKGAKQGSKEYNEVVLARDKMRDKYGKHDIGVWDEGAQRYNPAPSSFDDLAGGGAAARGAGDVQGIPESPTVNFANPEQVSPIPSTRGVIGEKGIENRIYHGTVFDFDPADIAIQAGGSYDGIWMSNSLKVADNAGGIGAGTNVTKALEARGVKAGKRRVLEYGLKDGAKVHIESYWSGSGFNDILDRAGDADVIAIRSVKDSIQGAEDAVYYYVRNPDVLIATPTTPATGTAAAARGVLTGRFVPRVVTYDKNAADLATYIRLNQDTYDAQGLMAVAEGLDPAKIKTTTVLDYVSSRYAPKNADGSYLYDDQLHAHGGSRSGATPGRAQKFMKERDLKNSEIDELIAKGEYGYKTPDESMREFIRGMKKGSLDAQHHKALKAIALEEGSGVFDYGSVRKAAQRQASKIAKGPTKSGKFRYVSSDVIEQLNHIGMKASAGVLEAVNNATRKNAKERNDIITKVKAALEKDFQILGDKTFIPTRMGGVPLKDSSRINKKTGKRVSTISREDRMPAYSGLLFENRQEVTRLVKQHYPKDDLGRLESFTNVLTEISDIIRLGKTGFDFGYHMIQGLPALGEAAAEATKVTSRTVGGVVDTAGARRARGRAKLKVWAKSIHESKKAFFDQDRMLATVADDIDLYREAVGHNLQMAAGSTDVFQAIRNGSILKRIPKVGEAIDEKLAKIAAPFQRAFLAPSDYIRFQYYKIDRESAMLAGLEGLTDPIEIAAKQQSNLQELAGSLNNMTGALSSAGMGINPTLNTVERGIVAFSARYTRSSLALLSDVFKGNIRGEKARNSLAGLVGLGMLSYLSMVEAMKAVGLEQDAKLDPTKSDFMTFDIAGDRIGFGGFWSQFSRLSSRVIETAWDEDAREMFLGDDTLRTNPIIRWIRGRSAPGAGVIWDGLMQEDYLGRDIESLADWTKHVGKQTTPIWFEASVLSSPYKTGFVGTPFELVGGRVNPMGASVRRKELRDRIAIDNYGARWADINGLQRDRISAGENVEVSLADLEKLQEFDAIVTEGTVERGDLQDIVVEKYRARRDDINDEFNVKIKEGRDFLTAGSIDLFDFRTLYLSSANSIRRNKLENLNDAEGEFAEAIAYFRGNAKRFGEDNPEDIAYNEYITSIIATDEFDDPMGLDWEAKEEAVEIFQATWGGDVYAYVMERFAVGRDMDVIVNEVYKGKQHFDYYWGDTEKATLASMPNSSALQEAYREYKKATDNRKFEMRETVPYLKEFIAKLGRVKKSMRETNVDLDRWLFRMGYSDSLVHPENKFSPDGADDAREYWRTPHPMPLQTFGIPVGTTL
jgi:hypothetical protein